MTHLPLDYSPYFSFIHMKAFNQSQKCFFSSFRVNNQRLENQHRFFRFGQVLSNYNPDGSKVA
jgi:hypothetical protein